MTATLAELSQKVIKLKENEIEEINSFSLRVKEKSFVRKSTMNEDNEKEIIEDEGKLQMDLVKMEAVVEDRYKEIKGFTFPLILRD